MSNFLIELSREGGKAMDSFMVCIEVDKHAFWYDMEMLLANCVENYVSDIFWTGYSRIIFPVKVRNNRWYLENEVSDWKIFMDGQELKNPTEIQHGSYIVLESEHVNYSLLFLRKKIVSKNIQYVKWNSGQKIYIGRSENNNIITKENNHVSRQQAVIEIDEKARGKVICLSNNVEMFLNGNKVVESELQYGDCIEVKGNVIYYMNQYFILKGNMEVNGLYALQKIGVIDSCKRKKYEYERTPRIYRNLSKIKINIDSPTPFQKMKEMPFLLSVGPSLTMTLAMMASFGVTLTRALNGGSIYSVITGGVMVFSMMMGAIFWPTLTRRYHKKQEKKNEEYRIKKYTTYLEKKEREIQNIYNRNKEVWKENLFPDVEKTAQIIRERDFCLWEKTKEDEDFLELRIGIGKRKFECEIHCPEEKFELYEDPMITKAIEIKERYKTLEDVPITVCLKRQRILGIFGDKERVEDTIRNLVFQILAFHSPEDVRLCVIGNSCQLSSISWVFNLPHCMSESGTIRYIASNRNEANLVFQHLWDRMHNEVEDDEEGETQKISYSSNEPWYVFLLLDSSFIQDFSFYKYLLDVSVEKKASAIFVTEQFHKLPKECRGIVQCKEDISGIYVKNENENMFEKIILDTMNLKTAYELADSLARMQRKINKENQQVAESISFLDMYKAGSLKQLFIRQKWENNMADKSLAVPIGAKAGGEMFYLDIHEKYHGCHGLVAGMTGSGKSEFLQTYILSAMLNYSPYEIAFVLVDFKGGDMARPFLKTPHLAATISDLSGSTLHRALVSLNAEVNYRKQLFNETALQLNIDKIDINSYQKYYKEKRIKTPLPHLVIVIDEFAQLKSQHPEFMAKLIDVAQVGRSLGIHLILATQKPSGVVDPQIWSNSRFKVCLKVLDKQDSKEMINRVDAAMIKVPGRAYVQVGYDEIFEQVQSGFSGASYIEKDCYIEDEEITIKMVDHTLSPIREAKQEGIGRKTKKTQLEEIVQEIVRLGVQKNVWAKHLWLDPLPEILYASDCIENYNITELSEEWDMDADIKVLLGKMDIIEEQRQPICEYSFVREGHLAIYGAAGTGKTTMLQQIIFSLVNRYSPEMLHIFALDFGGRNFGILNLLPHCVNVAFGEEEEKAAFMIDQILDCIEKRKILFAEKNCTSYESYLYATKQKLPAVMLIIDNYALFRERMAKKETDVIRIASIAKNYGVFMIVTGNSQNAIYYKLMEHIPKRIALCMNDKASYRDIFSGNRVELEPENIKGRGIIMLDKKVVEIQIALPVQADTESDRVEIITSVYKSMGEIYDGESVINQYEVSGIEKQQEPDSINNNRSADLSYRKKMPFTLPQVKEDGCHIICGTSKISGQLQGFSMTETSRIFIGTKDESNLNSFFEKIVKMNNMQVYTVTSEKNLVSIGEKISGEEKIHNLVNFLEKEMKERNQIRKNVKQQAFTEKGEYEILQKKERIVVVIEDFVEFYDVISQDDLDKLETLLVEQIQLGVYFITCGQIESMGDYHQTNLYLKLVKTPYGMILGGNIGMETLNYLHDDVTKISKENREQNCLPNEAILYSEGKGSLILLV